MRKAKVHLVVRFSKYILLFHEAFWKLFILIMQSRREVMEKALK